MAEGKTSEIRTWLLDEIKRGAFDRNAPLPGDLELAERFKVSRGTVRSALADLQRQGVIERRRGAGTFLSERGTRKSGVIGLLLPDFDAAGFFKDVGDAFVRCSRRCGYSVVIEKASARKPDEIAREMRRTARMLAVRPVEGVIFRPLIREDYSAIRVPEYADAASFTFSFDKMRPDESAAYRDIHVYKLP